MLSEFWSGLLKGEKPSPAHGAEVMWRKWWWLLCKAQSLASDLTDNLDSLWKRSKMLRQRRRRFLPHRACYGQCAPLGSWAEWHVETKAKADPRLAVTQTNSWKWGCHLLICCCSTPAWMLGSAVRLFSSPSLTFLSSVLQTDRWLLRPRVCGCLSSESSSPPSLDSLLSAHCCRRHPSVFLLDHIHRLFAFIKHLAAVPLKYEK